MKLEQVRKFVRFIDLFTVLDKSTKVCASFIVKGKIMDFDEFMKCCEADVTLLYGQYVCNIVIVLDENGDPILCVDCFDVDIDIIDT